MNLFYFNSFSAKGNLELFANNTDSGESARNELSHLQSALFASWLSKYSKTIKAYTIESPDFEHGRVYFKQFGAERVNNNPFGLTVQFGYYITEITYLRNKLIK